MCGFAVRFVRLAAIARITHALGTWILLAGLSAGYFALVPRACAAEPAKTGPLEVELDDLRPGLLAVYRSLVDKDAALTRIDAKPAFALGHSSVHPRFPAGPFEITWNGVLFLKETAPITFDAYVCGELTVEIDGVTVLQGRGERETSLVEAKAKLERKIGFYRLKIHYRSLADLPSRLQIWWQGPSFSREPLPAWQLSHLAADKSPALATEQLSDKGRHAVARLGCARCHGSGFPAVTEVPGPALADLGQRVGRAWLLAWLDDPARVHNDARMPALFTPDRKGFVERSLLADYLLGTDKPADGEPPGDHRMGRRHFVSIGCAACHFVPDMERKDQADFDRIPLTHHLADRMPARDLAAFIANPHGRYPDGRMPRLSVPPDMARDIAAYILLWSKPAQVQAGTDKPPTAEEINALAQRLRARGSAATAQAIVREKGCAQCHPGIGPGVPIDVPIKVADDSKGCLSGKTLPRYRIDAETAKLIAGYRAVGSSEKHASPFASRQQLVERSGCLRCHQRDSDRPPPLEAIGSTLGGAYLQLIPFQRTPRLSYLHQKYNRGYLVSAVREGVSGLRPSRFSYRMPAFGHDAEAILQAIAESDGELPASPEPQVRQSADPTLGTLSGPVLAGFQGYACVSCHIWNGQTLSEPDPGAVGTDLTRVFGRIRRDWFDRFLEDPARCHPGTPMPAVFPKGKRAMLPSVLDGDSGRQKDALWSYFALGKDAPSPKPPPPLPVIAPAGGESPLCAQVPLHLPSGTILESICVLWPSHDLAVYDVGTHSLHSAYTGAEILRGVQGRLRTFTAAGKLVGTGFATDPAWQLIGGDKPDTPTVTLQGYDRLADGIRIRSQAVFGTATVDVAETLRIVADGSKRHLVRELRFGKVPAGRSLAIRTRVADSLALTVTAIKGQAKSSTADGTFTATLAPDNDHNAHAAIRYELPPGQVPPVVERIALADAGRAEGSLERPGYRAIAYPRPKTASGEDLIMPGAVAAHPVDGRVFVASMKLGEIFVLRDPADDGKSARYENYARGLYQEAWSMLAERDGLYVLHRRNLTKIVDSDGDGTADRFDRVFALPHGIANTYDYGYGLVRDKTGAFVVSYAPYANHTLPGSGGAVRWEPGKKPEEIAYGFRNPVGWASGPDGEVFYTDNQGEWVATNKLCHIVPGRFYGFPNSQQRQHATKPFGKTTVWVPYGWARSINGMTYDNSNGKFGPFAGQFFLSELMYGGAIIRASVEKVNGEYQGACFPFWGKGLMGPVTLAFDPRGRMFVGGITEPGWMAQPDRGGLFRIDFTGQVPFEMQTIQVRPRGFRIVFTKPVAPETAKLAASYAVEHYRYEYTGAYGSPELDRTRAAVERVELSADGKTVDLTTAALVKDRVYMIDARVVRSATGESLVHPTGAYTLNEIPAAK